MELRNMQTFVTLAEVGSFTKTAEMIGYSQSNVTMQIQQLEKELGVPLFHRVGKKIYLTEKGKHFLDYTNRILSLTTEAIDVVSVSDEAVGVLRIGMAESLSSVYLKELVPLFHDRCPQVELIITSGKKEELFEKLNKNQLDYVMIIDTPIYDDNWEKDAENKEKTLVVGPLDAAGKYSSSMVSIHDMLEEKFIMTEQGYGYRHAFDMWCMERKASVTNMLEIGNTEIIKSFVISGLGFSLLPQFAVEKEINNGKLCSIDIESLDINVYSQLIRYKQRWVTKQMRVFRELWQAIKTKDYDDKTRRQT